MGNKQKKSYAGVRSDGTTMICDSDEEVYFTWWMFELFCAGYIQLYDKAEEIYLSPSYDKVVWTVKKPFLKEVEIMSGHKYTPDFYIEWAEKASGIFFSLGNPQEELFTFEVGDGNQSLVEVKPAFDQNNMTRLAIVNIKWVKEKHGDHINLIIPNNIPDKGKRQRKKCLFHETFTPKKYVLTNISGKPRSIKHPVRSLEDYLLHVQSIKEKYAIQRSVLDV